MADHGWIGETFTSTAGWSHLESLVDIGDRMAGSEGELRGARATSGALSAYARDVHLDEFEITGWERGDSAITAGDREHESIALPRSPAGEATGELVDLEYGLPADFESDLEGAVVVVRSDVPDHHDRFIHRREKYYRAAEAGAVAFVFRNHVEGCLAPTGSVGTPEAPIGPIPAVGVSKEVGARLLRREAGTPVTVSVDCDTGDAISHNVHADIGPDTDAAVYLTAHHDAHDIAEGAMDNGAGTAAVVECARALATRADAGDLDTRIHVCVFGSEEVGLLGAHHEAARIDPGAVKCILNLDGVVRGRSLYGYTHGFGGLGEVLDRVASRFDHPIRTVPHQNPHSDHWPFVERGLPGLHMMSETGDRGRGWGHTRADTFDKLDVRNLRENAVLLTDLAVTLADAERTFEARPFEAIVDDLEAQDLAEGMRIIGDLPAAD